ncbi:MAG: hypothetical protein LUK37_11370, partial [Clostridia bacterium]|nr:hypothetical protein [Clostridia bacterium]
MLNKKKQRFFPMLALVTAILSLVSVGYLIYQKSVRDVIYAITISFMEQIAEHDQQNMINQMDSKRLALETIVNRVDASRGYTMPEILADLKLNVVSGTFQRLYLVMDTKTVYSQTALMSDLEDMTW